MGSNEKGEGMDEQTDRRQADPYTLWYRLLEDMILTNIFKYLKGHESYGPHKVSPLKFIQGE